MLDIPADARRELFLSLCSLIEQSTALADALGMDEAAAELRSVRVQVSGPRRARVLPGA